MEHDTKTEKKSKTTGTPPKSFYTPIDNGSTQVHQYQVKSFFYIRTGALENPIPDTKYGRNKPYDLNSAHGNTLAQMIIKVK
jgi:hypothetical protein